MRCDYHGPTPAICHCWRLDSQSLAVLLDLNILLLETIQQKGLC